MYIALKLLKNNLKESQKDRQINKERIDTNNKGWESCCASKRWRDILEDCEMRESVMGRINIGSACVYVYARHHEI